MPELYPGVCFGRTLGLDEAFEAGRCAGGSSRRRMALSQV
jgi:hypothetical protein